MRPIDADDFDRRLVNAEFSAALFNADDEDRPFKQEAMYYFTQSFRDVMSYQPTLNIISVEWLMQKTKDPDLYTQGCAKRILGCWKKEQEAING